VQPLPLQRPVNHHLQVGRVVGLGDEVVGPLPHRLDGVLQAPVGRHHDDGGRDPLSPDPLEELDAAHLRHLEVQEDEGGVELRELGQRLPAGARGAGLESEEAEAVPQGLPVVRVVVHDEDPPAPHRPLRLPPWPGG